MIAKALRALRHPVVSVKKQANRLGRSKYCYICGKRFGAFLPFRGGWAAAPPFLLDLGIVANDPDNADCPCCGNSDRLRHLFMYFDRLNLWSKIQGRAVLHIAPEEPLSRRINACLPSTYVRGDLSPSDPTIEKVDITDISYGDNVFDMVICNHVLEHVTDDGKALSEFYRVLRPGGCAILQTPYSGVLANTFVDPAITSEDARRRFYGQEDHVRLYGRDLFTRIEKSGLRLDLKKHSVCLNGMDPSYYGVNVAEDLILAVK